ncbi:LANO_0H21220g1_1 [Lachancea nothofagi CBS 11611]|uniref:LANO_0H21220g1_1 n=1 Tax=Lachancea nothofagi CBS 11611 TaxID=1266666 RepID=A0A1G4KNP6_9SACH|nr:LANO_0H21220g1_1 [Lachancea nothofagi CBS 11611]
MFKKKHDPFEELLKGDKPQPVEKGFLQKVVSTSDKSTQDNSTVAAHKYSSPFRDSQQLAAAQKRKTQKFPTVMASGPGVTGPDLGYKVIDAARKRAKDIAVPRYLQGNDERQRRKLDKLERKEDSLQYKKDSQRIVNVREDVVLGKEPAEEPAEGKVVEEKAIEGPVDESLEEPVEKSLEEPLEEPIEEPLGEPVEKSLEQPAEKSFDEPAENSLEEPAETSREEPVEGSHQKPVEKSLEDPVVNDQELVGAMPAKEPIVDPNTSTVPPPEPLEISETTAVAPLDVAAEPTTAEPIASESAVALSKAPSVSAESAAAAAPADLENLASDNTDAAGLVKPKDIKEAPRVPFATGIFALWTRSDKRGQPVASPDDPEFIVKFDKGYMSKALYDTLEYEEAVHKQEMDEYTKENTAKYDAKAQEYQDNLTSLKAQITEIEATMEQLRKDTAEKIKVSETELTSKMIDSNAKHSVEKNAIFKETENIKGAKLQEKETVEGNQEQVKAEIEELQNEKAELDADYQEHQTRVDGLTADLDSKLAAIQELNAKQTEVEESIAALNQRKEELVAEADSHDQQHGANVAVVESIKNKEYLPQINAIDAQTSELLTSLTFIKQETANQKTEFAAVTKRLEEENEERKEKLRLEEEARKREEEERLQKQRDEHDQKVLLLQQDHQRQLDEASKTALEAKEAHQLELDEASKKAADMELTLQQEREQRELKERENTRLHGERAIQEQEKTQLVDKALEDDLKQKNHNRAQALDGAEAARERNAQIKSTSTETAVPEANSDAAVMSTQSINTNKDNSLYEYFTENEIKYVTPAQSRA